LSFAWHLEEEVRNKCLSRVTFNIFNTALLREQRKVRDSPKWKATSDLRRCAN
jgi:hypothetical protein